MRVVTCTSLLVAQLLVLTVCSITTTDGIGTTVCPPGGASAGPTSLSYSVYDDTQNSWYPSAVILTDPISVLGCCGFVTGFTLVVNGDTTNGACESGCQIDFVIWKDIVDNTATSGYYGATVHGVINDVTVTTDTSWTGGAQSVPYTYYLPQSEWIALDPGVNYYPGWNGETYTAVDYIIQYTTECSDANVHCTPASNYYTTESSLNSGFTQGSLSPGNAEDYFDFGTSDRFFAFQVIVEAGTPPSFVSPGTTMYVEPSLTAGSSITTAKATNPETFETLTYAKAAETPTTVACFDVDSTTGAITSAVDLSTTCLGQHNVTVRVTDGCMFALTTYTFIVATTTTTASEVTAAAATTAGSAAAASAGSGAAATAAGSLVTTSGGTGTSTSTTAAATTTTVTTTTTAPTTTPGLFDTTTGKIIIGMIAGLALLLVGAAIGLCVVLSKNSAAAGSVNQVTEATPGQTTYPTSFSDGFKQPPPAIDDDYSHMLKIKSKQRYLNSEKKAWDWT